MLEIRYFWLQMNIGGGFLPHVDTLSFIDQRRD